MALWMCVSSVEAGSREGWGGGDRMLVLLCTVRVYVGVYTNDDLFHRLETVHFSVLSLVRVTWRIRAEVIQNPEA